ncbi:GAF domain-containing protein [uncultured Paracoccus sp.]|uniref:GAF domain-containing protein n=1 Tax=uncultured Paracoccus sp. TaxID=189685 RepID=UPI0026172A77|nr:GAF domain-containing protein [uncultured Paracoccus sp.]
MIHPFPDTETEAHRRELASPDRLAAVTATGLIDSLPEEAFDRVVRLATKVTGVPVGLFTLVDDRHQAFKAREGLAGENATVTETPLSSSFCQYVVTSDQPLAVSDARTHPLLSQNGAVAGLGVIAYLGVPIHAPGGQVIGSLCAIDHEPQDWTEDQAASLRDLAAVVETELALRHSMAERAMILTELNHRVKNLFAMVGGMVRLARREHQDVEALAGDIEARVNALARAHQLIVPTSALDPAAAAGVPLDELLASLLAPYDQESDAHRIEAIGPDVPLGPKATTHLALALHELATNSVKYGALCLPDGRLRLGWRLGADHLQLDWIEQGVAPAQPGTEGPANGSGFGSQLLEMTIEGQLQGQFETSRSEAGLSHRISIPLPQLAR